MLDRKDIMKRLVRASRILDKQFATVDGWTKLSYYKPSKGGSYHFGVFYKKQFYMVFKQYNGVTPRIMTSNGERVRATCYSDAPTCFPSPYFVDGYRAVEPGDTIYLQKEPIIGSK